MFGPVSGNGDFFLNFCAGISVVSVYIGILLAGFNGEAKSGIPRSAFKISLDSDCCSKLLGGS